MKKSALRKKHFPSLLSSFLQKQEPRIIACPKDMSYSTGLLRSARNDASGDVRKWVEGASINHGRHCEQSEAIQDKQLKPNGLTTFFKSIVFWVPAFAGMTTRGWCPKLTFPRIIYDWQ